MRIKLNTTIEIIFFMFCVTIILLGIMAMISWIFTPNMIIDFNFNMNADNNSLEIIKTLNNTVFGETQI